MINTKVLAELKKAVESGAELTVEQVRKLAELRKEISPQRKDFVRVGKLALLPGEDVQSFVWTMYEAVQTDRIILGDGSLDVGLDSIFEDHVIVRDWNTGRLFRADFTRESDGTVKFSDPVEVRVEFVPISSADNGVAKRAPEELVALEKNSAGKWEGVLPASLRR